MTPYERAKAVYTTEACARTFEEDLVLHRSSGYVFNEPAFFVMGRPVFSKAPAHMIVDPRVRFSVDICDCWHLYLFAGDLVQAWAVLPYELPRFSFERKNDLRIYPSASIRRLSLGNALPNP